MDTPVRYISDEENQIMPNSQQSEDSSQEHHDEEPMEKPTKDVDIMENTQAILERPAAATAAPKKKPLKGKGIGKANVLKQKRAMQTLSFFIWLKNYWDIESTMLIMPRFITAIKKHALQTQNAGLGKLVRPLNQVMKQFILDTSKQGHNLKKISWDAFESWALGPGLSTMYSNCHTMVWEKDFEDLLFKIYGQVYLDWSAEKQQDSSEEEEEQSSSRNITTTSMSSTTVRTAEDHVDADLCDISRNTQPKKNVTFSRSKSGHSSTNPSILKSKTSVKKSTSVSAKRQRKQSSSDEETDEEPIILPPKTKKQKVMTSEESESDPENCDNLNDMLDAAVQAQCLLRNTGSISQNMSLKHLDSVVTLKSRGERGTKVIKLEVYPFADCLRKERQEWWKYAEMRSLFLEYSEGSRVSTLLQKLTKEAFKQIKETKKCEIKSAVYKRT